MKKLAYPTVVCTFAFSVLLPNTATGQQRNVQEIETPPPAVQGSTGTKKLPSGWRLQPSTNTSSTPRYKEVPAPETNADKRKFSNQTDDEVKKGWLDHSRDYHTPD